MTAERGELRERAGRADAEERGVCMWEERRQRNTKAFETKNINQTKCALLQPKWRYFDKQSRLLVHVYFHLYHCIVFIYFSFTSWVLVKSSK